MDLAAQLEAIYKQEFRRLFATVVRLIGDFDLAEEMLQEAFLLASQKWAQEGIPANPRAWLVSVARHKALDQFRRQRRFTPLEDAHLELEAARHEPDFDSDDIEDDRLRLIFTCCHPALDMQVRVALTLREVCGLATDAIASAFLVQTPTMAQRLVRGKAKIRTAGIPYVVPQQAELAERLEAVLSVIYLVYNEGYRTSSGTVLNAPELADEAIRLGRLLVELLPESESLGLLALMLLNEARRPARSSAAGELILLEDQDRSLWRTDWIEEGQALLQRALETGTVGPYGLQAAISAQHCRASSVANTDWTRIVSLYDALLELTASPVVALNRAVALSMQAGPEAALEQLRSLAGNKLLLNYYPLHVAHAELSRRAGDLDAARSAYQRALQLVQQEPERRHLRKRLASLGTDV